MTVDVASLALRVDALEVKDAEQSLKRMQKAGADAESGLQGSTEAIVGQFKKVAGIAAAAYAAVQTLGGASRDFIAFDKTLGEISTQLLGATDRVKEFANESQNLALTFGSNLTDQSKAFYEVLSTGITDTREATELLTAANKLAIGGNSNLGVAISGLTNIVKGYGDKVKDVNDVSDTLFTASLAGKISIEELAEGLGRVIPLADAVDVGLAEVSSAVAALTLTGVSARESITSVRAVLAALVKPSSEAADEAERLGLKFDASAIKAKKGFLPFLEDLKQKTGGSVASLALLFGGVEAILPALNLVNNGGREFNQIMQQQAERAGITNKAFAQMAETADFKVNRFFAAMNVISKEVGATLASILTPAAEGAANALSRLLFKTQNLTDIEQQQKKINDLTESLEKMRGRNAVVPFADNFIYSKKDLDEAESRIDQAKADLQELLRVKEEAAKPIAPLEEQKLTPNDPPKIATATKEKQAAISESERFLKALKEESMQAGVTGIALIELKAGYLGVADAAAPYIQKMRESEAALTAQKDLNAQYARDMEKVKQITLEVASAEDTFIAKQNELNRLLSTGQLGPDTYFKALEKAGDDMRKTVQGGNQDFEQLKFAVQGWGRAATDALVDFAVSGKGSFSSFAESVLKDILRMYVQMQLITPLLQSLPGLSFGGGGASATTSAASSVFSNLFKGFRASGGPTSPNSLYQVNERGTPELFASGGKQFLLTGNQSGQVTPTQVGRAGGGMGNVVVNLVEAPGKGGQVSQKQTASGMEIDVMVDQLVAKKTREQGSATNKSLRQNFGVSDNLVMR